MQEKSKVIIAISGLGLTLSWSAITWADDLTLYYHSRPPYAAVQPNGEVAGITADIAANALALAGISYHWEEMPSARQLVVLKENASAACGLGWFKRPEREAFANFSAALYKDHPTVAVSRADDARFPETPSIAQLFADKRLVLLLKNGYSYGPQIDAWIKAGAPSSRTSSTDNIAMLRLVERQRVDYMLMASEEANYLLAQPDFASGNLKIHNLSDAPEGEVRYLMCTHMVPPALMDKLDQAIPPL